MKKIEGGQNPLKFYRLSKRTRFGFLVLILFAIFSLGLLVLNIRTSQDIRQKAAGLSSGDDCYVMVYAKGDNEPMPVRAHIEMVSGQPVCVGGVDEIYTSYYQTRSEALADKQTVNYPCKPGSDFATRVGDSCMAGGMRGQALCLGGPELVYLGCLAQSATSQALDFIDGPDQVPPDIPFTPTPTPTTRPHPTNTPTPTTRPHPTNTPTPTTRPHPTNTPTPTPNPGSGGRPLCAENCIPRSADLNGDGWVDILDYTIMTAQFNL